MSARGASPSNSRSRVIWGEDGRRAYRCTYGSNHPVSREIPRWRAPPRIAYGTLLCICGRLDNEAEFVFAGFDVLARVVVLKEVRARGHPIPYRQRGAMHGLDGRLVKGARLAH